MVLHRWGRIWVVLVHVLSLYILGTQGSEEKLPAFMACCLSSIMAFAEN